MSNGIIFLGVILGTHKGCPYGVVRIFMLFACASRPSVIANLMMSSALSASWSLSYSMMDDDFIKSLLVTALKYFVVWRVGRVWLGPAM